MRYLNSILVTGGVALMPASYAYADTFTQMVETVKSSTTYTFGVGAAAGAIVAGLLGLALHARSKRRYKRQMQHLEQKVEDSERIAGIAQSRLISLEEEFATYKESVREGAGEGTAAVVDEVALKDEAVAGQSEFAEDALEDSAATGGDAYVGNADEADAADEEARPLAAVEDEGANEVAEPESVPEPEPELKSEPEAEPEPELKSEPEAEGEGETEPEPEPERPVSFASRRTVRMVLDERLTPDALGDGFGKFATRLAHTSETPAFLGHRRARQYDPVIRASLIDQRVPRFDESLFPDVVSHVHDEVDIFETAMRAMEDTLQHTAVLGIEESETLLYAPTESERPEIIDAAAYVDFILQDEIEKTKSGEPLSTTDSHLKMFEGTGDLNASKKIGTHQPDHMRSVSDKA